MSREGAEQTCDSVRDVVGRASAFSSKVAELVGEAFEELKTSVGAMDEWKVLVTFSRSSILSFKLSMEDTKSVLGLCSGGRW